MQLGASAHQMIGQSCACIDDVFAIIKDDQCVALLEVARQNIKRVSVRLLGQLERSDDNAGRLGLIDESQTNLENYITQKTLDGLFLLIADEEKAIRANPLEQGSKLLNKVFGAVLNN